MNTSLQDSLPSFVAVDSSESQGIPVPAHGRSLSLASTSGGAQNSPPTIETPSTPAVAAAAKPKDTPCQYCDNLYTSRGVVAHQARCPAKYQADKEEALAAAQRVFAVMKARMIKEHESLVLSWRRAYEQAATEIANLKTVVNSQKLRMQQVEAHAKQVTKEQQTIMEAVLGEYQKEINELRDRLETLAAHSPKCHEPAEDSQESVQDFQRTVPEGEPSSSSYSYSQTEHSHGEEQPAELQQSAYLGSQEPPAKKPKLFHSPSRTSVAETEDGSGGDDSDDDEVNVVGADQVATALTISGTL